MVLVLRHFVRLVKSIVFFFLWLLQPITAEESWRTALGDISQLADRQQVWFESVSEFETKSHPYGESVADFRSYWHNSPGDGRRTIVIRWLGEKPPTKLLERLRSYLRSFFTLPVRIELAEQFDWPRPERGKVSAEKIQKRLLRNLPGDAFVVIGLTDKDIFSEDNGPDYLLFGQGHYYNRSAVASLNRLQTSDTKLLNHRVFKLVSHELVHTFSMEHCGYFRCLMNSSGSIESSDKRPLFLCPVCLRKMHTVLEFDPGERYRRLAKTVRSTLPRDLGWLRRRLGQERG